MKFKDLDLKNAKLLNPNRHENPKYLLNNKIYRRFDDSIHIFIIKYYLDGFKKYYNNFELHSDFIIRDFTPGQTSDSVKNIQKIKSYFFKCFGDGDLFYPDDFLHASNTIRHICIDEEMACGLLLKRFKLLDSVLVCQKLDISESELKNAIDQCRNYLNCGEIIRLYR
ncbi:hypothetical protein BHV26_08230 [Campylobacter coli]|nr:hypothetical protein [Campylobacter jejuni]EAK3475192.1 hypothetical protein [Campylobacter coli]